MRPTDVRLHRADGTVVDCELEHAGVTDEGIDMWLVVGLTYCPGDRLTVGVLPARTGIDFAASFFDFRT